MSGVSIATIGYSDKLLREAQALHVMRVGGKRMLVVGKIIFILQSFLWFSCVLWANNQPDFEKEVLWIMFALAIVNTFGLFVLDQVDDKKIPSI